MALTYMEL